MAIINKKSNSFKLESKVLEEKAEKLEYGSVLITDGEYEGKLGYYDNDEFDEELGKEVAVVYLGTPFQSDYLLIEHDCLHPIISLKHERFKRENPDLVAQMGIK